MWWWASALAADLAGTVAGADGAPVVGATVTVYDQRFNYAAATTRNEGQWSISGLPGGPYRVRVQPSNSDPHADLWYPAVWAVCEADIFQLNEESVVEDVDISLSVGAAIAGVLADRDNNPVEGAVVTVSGVDERTSLVQRYARTDAAGAYKVVGLDADSSGSPFVLESQMAGWPDQYWGGAYDESNAVAVTAAPAGVSELEPFVLLDGISVSGTIRSADGPLESATVYVYSSAQVLVESTTADGSYIADGLPPGDVVAWAGKSGFATTYYPDSDRPGGSVPVPNEGATVVIDLELPPDNPITLRFSGEGDLSTVSVLVYNDTYTVGRGDVVGIDGEVTLTGFYPGNYFVYVYGESGGFTSGFLTDNGGSARVFAVSGPAAFDVALDSAATLSGRITDDRGLPVYGASVLAREPGGERQWSDVTDADGNYEIRGVASTTLELSAQYYWYCPNDPGWVDTWYDTARSSEDARLLAAVSGEHLEALNFSMPHDDDHDNMGDLWEAANGLDPTRDDSAEDADGDGYSNLQEWIWDSDPTGTSGLPGECACGTGGAAGGGALSALLALLGGMRRRVRAHESGRKNR